ncbi:MULTISPECIES: PTS IIA-like nitrogen regulatory protein PtsN [Basfia]|uniref:PtsN protein n=2 Tax=Basfia TaxID=697331 RepID=Q65RT6_MANSM|nr:MULTISPECIES: PTS IIA-like nitrogen regulatory protein PtsN [Basfia]AAU38324.1 PtsN protein [[Mannheimia] succiniciproducens MBEL55E]QIM68954.1 PTS IIA-like nitrogen-regulatory protein PtsN [Basfia succiniciproducens]SCY00766.1 PTS IIA-like nitrogen-regulatory protein PtsN [Basfia succiniciproducens]SEQ37744.1 PTS IIA-like nitrogen-regulatory protein PtsN [Basfia succiniciproducens]
MVKFTEILSPENIRQGIICSSKKRLLEVISDIVTKRFNLQEEEIGYHIEQLECFETLLSREKLGCTSLGNGIAMPRAKLPIGDKPVAVFLQLASPVNYEAPDKRDVDLVLAILIPEKCCAAYSPYLPELAERFSDKMLCKQLRAAQSADEIWQIFQYMDNCLHEHTDDTATEEK